MIAKKSLGQHWLKDDKSLESMCDAAGVAKGDHVLEIGPGTGELTKKLLGRGASVVAVELDEELAQSLNTKFKGLPFTLNMLSILDFDFSTMPDDYKIVANIPYYLTNHLLRMLTEIQHMPTIAVLLVQKEVAERVAAKPGQMSIVSVVAQLDYQVSSGMLVPAKLFDPAPKVDSQILILNKRTTPLFDNFNRDLFIKVVKAGFSQRRKTILNSLSAGLHLSKQQTENILTLANIDPKNRAQQLSLDNWNTLTTALLDNT